MGVEIALERTLERNLGGREGSLRRARPDQRGGQARPFAAGGGDGDAELGHLGFDGGKPGLVRRGLGEEPVPPAHRLLEGVEAGAVLAVDGEHRAVEEAAALGGGAGEEAIHRRRQPEHAKMLEQRLGGARRRVVDADAADTLRAFRREGDAGADLDRARRR